MRFFNSVKALYAAVGILFITYATGFYVDTREGSMQLQRLEVSTGLEKMVRLSQELNSMLLVAVLDRNLLRVSSYDTVNNNLEETMKSVIGQTKSLRSSMEIETLSESQAHRREFEERIIALIRSDAWNEARETIFGDEYVFTRKTNEIDIETAVGAIMGELSNTADLNAQINVVTTIMRALAFVLLVWVGIAFSRRSRADLKEQIRLREEILFAKEELEERVKTRTMDLENRTRELAMENEERLKSEEITSVQRATLNSLINAIPDLIFYKDQNHRYLGCNEAYAALSGRKAADIVGWTDAEVHPSEQAGRFMKSDDEVFSTLKANRYERWVTYPDGHQALHETLKAPFWDEKGKLLGVMGISHDITDLKKAEEVIRESEKQLRTIVENSPLGIIHMSNDGTIKTCNEKFVQLMGSTREKLIGFNSVRQGRDNAMIGALQKALAGETAEYESLYTSATGGKTVPLHIKFNPVDAGQDPTEVIVTLEDISDRKKVERELKEHLEELEKFNRLTVNREEKMIELKKEINDAFVLLGKKQKYKIVE